MTQAMTAGLKLLTDRAAVGGPILLEVAIKNETDMAVYVSTFEPAVAPPELGQCSIESYKTSVLISIGILVVELYDERDDPVESRFMAPWVTPILVPKPLGPGDSHRLTLDVSELFNIHLAGRYRAHVEFRDANVDAAADLAFEIGPDGPVGTP